MVSSNLDESAIWEDVVMFEEFLEIKHIQLRFCEFLIMIHFVEIRL